SADFRGLRRCQCPTFPQKFFGSWKLIHNRLPPGSPSGMRLRYGPHCCPIAAKTSSGESSATLPTKCTFAILSSFRTGLARGCAKGVEEYHPRRRRVETSYQLML